MKQKILQDGYVLLDNYFDTTKYDVVNTISNHLDKVHVLSGKNLMTRYSNLLGTDPVFQDLLVETGIMDIAHQILGDCINLSDLQMVRLHPGSPGINPHIDYPFILMDEIFYSPIAMVQTLWALDDFTIINGATRIVPRSHKRCGLPNQEIFANESQELLIKRGSVVVMHGGTWHGTSPNNSTHDRSSLLMSFAPPWVKPIYDIGKNVIGGVPAAIRELLGHHNIRHLSKTLALKQKELYS